VAALTVKGLLSRKGLIREIACNVAAGASEILTLAQQALVREKENEKWLSYLTTSRASSATGCRADGR
jgi:hypothetical protein